uniref:Putative e3 ubiquitin-protein ligase ari4 n=1 Tax=Panstrongylus lignarius TaxID=156445 RepID=A0A224XNC3_9HEMI
MRMINKTLFWSAALITICVGFFPQDVSAVWCYQCNSAYNEDCATITPNDTKSIFYKSCNPEEKNVTEMFCRKLVQRIHDREGLIRVVRSCGWILDPKEDCYKARSAGREEISCQCFTDGCNPASAITTSFLTIFTSFIFVYIFI